MAEKFGMILAGIPPELREGFSKGTIERVGMLLRDSGSKRIVAHLQETGLTQKLAGTAFKQAAGLFSFAGGGPLTAASGIATIIQNEQIKSKLDVMQTMMGGLQTLQVANLITSVAGIGVTVASTAIILSRMKRMEQRIADLAGAADAARLKLEDWDLGATLKAVEVQLERMAEAEFARNPERIFDEAEHELHKGFSELHRGTAHVLGRDRIDPDFLSQLLATLSICGTAQIRALVWLDEKPRARSRARTQVEHLQTLAMQMPQDVLAQRFGGSLEAVASVDALALEMRMRVASLPSLVQVLEAREINGRAYLERAAAEEEDPLLLVVAPEEESAA